MHSSLISFLLVLLVEGISVIVSYLTERLQSHMHRHDFGFNPETV